MLVKGVSFDRNANDSNMDYVLMERLENVGVRYYVHRYHLGLHPYYLQLRVNDLIKEKEYNKKLHPQKYLELLDDQKELMFKLRKEMAEKNLSVMVRIIMLYRVQDKSFTPISGPESLYHYDYTGNHIVIFENQLKHPPSLQLIDDNPTEYLNQYKINFRNWRIVDIDHFMKGNSYFSKKLEPEDFIKKLQRNVGSEKTIEVEIKTDEQYKQIEKLMTEY